MGAKTLAPTLLAKVLPRAVAEGWSTRKLAEEARIDQRVAMRELRVVAAQQKPAIASAELIEGAGSIRLEVSGAAKELCVKLRSLVATADSLPACERAGRALESALRVADNLDGLAHLRASELRGREQAQTAPRGVIISDLLTSADSPMPSDSHTIDAEFHDSDSSAPSASSDAEDC